MDLIEGHYTLDRNENFLEYLQAVGIPDEYSKLANSEKPSIEFKIEGKYISLSSSSKLPNSSSVLIIDELVEEQTPIGLLMVKSTLEDNIITSFYRIAGETGQKIYTFSESGVEVTLTSDKADILVARRIYKRDEFNTK